MTPVKSLTAFHHWLLGDAPDTQGFLRSIVLHGAQKMPNLSAAIAHYLNQYDDEANCRWMAMETLLIEAIAGDHSQRKLLGMGEPCEKCPPTGPCGLRKVIKAAALHGHVVLDSIHAPAATQELEGVFHVSLQGSHKDCHMFLNPERFNEKCLAPIIGDVYLEWLNCTFRKSTEA